MYHHAAPEILAHVLATKMMFWALARVSFRAAKIVSCNKNIFFMVYHGNYFNCSTLYHISLLGINISLLYLFYGSF
jgi:hypothetical protein